MTIAEAIQRIDTLKPNRYRDKEKVMWLSELDGQIYSEIIMAHEGDVPPFAPYKYTEPEDGVAAWQDIQLLVPFPYSELYQHWLAVQIDLANAEINKYAQDKELFNSAYMTFGDYYTRTHMPVQHVREFQL